MLIRFTVENVFSFGERKEFSMIPYSGFKTLKNHKYSILDFNVLKMASIYGANGAGKSNLIKSLNLLQKLVLKEDIPFRLNQTQFKLVPKEEAKSQILAVEFFQEDCAFYYALELSNGIIKTEELYESGLGLKADKLLYERRTDNKNKTTINFFSDFEKEEKNKILKSVLIEEFIKPSEPILKIISNRDNQQLAIVKKAFNWFNDTLLIITPESKPIGLAHEIDTEPDFKKYAEDLMCSFNLGITSLNSENKDIYSFFGKDNKRDVDNIIKRVEESPSKILELINSRVNTITVVKENEKIWVKQLKVGHSGIDNKNIMFDLEEESDGTVRLLDFLPAFKDVLLTKKVFIVDEIERSIHPLLIKELVTKFSLDNETRGQFIFTTHESNLLDQEIFRLDEIWFAEKDKNGSTDLYSLSEFKEHKTIDIRKGYLNGRYGSIPFLANLKDLNWHQYDFKK